MAEHPSIDLGRVVHGWSYLCKASLSGPNSSGQSLVWDIHDTFMGIVDKYVSASVLKGYHGQHARI